MHHHDTFNVSLLHKYYGLRLTPSSIEIADEQYWEVSHILKHRGKPRHYQYLVRWKGFDASEDMWLPEAELAIAPDLLRDYKSRAKLI